MLQALNSLTALPADIFADSVEQCFVTSLSDGTQVEVIPGGSSVPVTHENVSSYVAAVVRARLEESKPLARAIAKGFNHVVPLSMLSLFSWYARL